MAKTNYAWTDFGHDTAKAYGQSLSISTKTSVNICSHIRGWRAEKAASFLDKVAAGTEAVPFRRFTDGVGHRRGNMAAGRYPVKASIAIAALIRSAISNAANKGLDEDLRIAHICAHKASTPFHQGRQRRRAMKRTHIEVVVQEIVKSKSKESVSKDSKTKSSKDKKSVEKKETKKPVKLVKENIEPKESKAIESEKTQ